MPCCYHGSTEFTSFRITRFTYCKRYFLATFRPVGGALSHPRKKSAGLAMATKMVGIARIAKKTDCLHTIFMSSSSSLANRCPLCLLWLACEEDKGDKGDEDDRCTVCRLVCLLCDSTALNSKKTKGTDCLLWHRLEFSIVVPYRGDFTAGQLPPPRTLKS